MAIGKGEATDLLQRGTEWLAEERDMLYAQNRWSLLLVFQAMDAAGKDGTVKHAMSELIRFVAVAIHGSPGAQRKSAVASVFHA